MLHLFKGKEEETQDFTLRSHFYPQLIGNDLKLNASATSVLKQSHLNNPEHGSAGKSPSHKAQMFVRSPEY